MHCKNLLSGRPSLASVAAASWLALVAALCPVRALAATTLSAGTCAGLPGSTMQLTVSLTTDTNVFSGQFDLDYSTNYLVAGWPAPGSALGTPAFTCTQPSPGVCRVAFSASADMLLTNGSLAVFPFTSAANSPDHNEMLQLTNVVLNDDEGWPVPAGAVSGLVQIIIPPCFSSITPTNGGTMHLAFSGAPGRTYVTMAATDLSSSNWVPLGTNTVGAGGSGVEFDDISASAYRSRFYRTVAVQTAGAGKPNSGATTNGAPNLATTNTVTTNAVTTNAVPANTATSNTPAASIIAQAYFQNAGVTNPAAQAAISNWIAGLQSRGLWAGVAETAWFESGQNNGTTNPVGILGTVGYAQGANPPDVALTGQGFSLDGNATAVIFTNQTPVSGPMTLVVFGANRSWGKTADQKLATLQAPNCSKGCMILDFGNWNQDLTTILSDGGHNYRTGNGTLDFNPHSWASVYDGGSNIYAMTDGANPLQAGVLVSNTVSMTTLVLGGGVTTGAPQWGWNGLISGFVLFTNALTPAQVAFVTELAKTTVWPQTRMVLDGASIANFTGGVCQTNAPYWGTGNFINEAVSGQLSSTMWSNFPLTTMANAPNGADIPSPATLVLLGTLNSITQPVGGAAAAEAYMTEYVNAARALQYYPIAVGTLTEPLLSIAASPTAAVDWTNYNAWILTNGANADIVLDQDAVLVAGYGQGYVTNPAVCNNTGHPYGAALQMLGSNVSYYVKPAPINPASLTPSY